MIHYDVPPCVGKEIEYIRDAIEKHYISGDGEYTQKCNVWLEERFNAKK
jgi:dTDP-4-amino-4,6-dideoxygalactose transaminase